MTAKDILVIISKSKCRRRQFLQSCHCVSAAIRIAPLRDSLVMHILLHVSLCLTGFSISFWRASVFDSDIKQVIGQAATWLVLQRGFTSNAAGGKCHDGERMVFRAANQALGAVDQEETQRTPALLLINYLTTQIKKTVNYWKQGAQWNWEGHSRKPHCKRAECVAAC